MGTLDEFLNSILTKEFRPARLIARLIAKKLRQQGVILSEDQIQAIEADLSDKQPDQLHIELTEEQKRTLSSSTLKDDSDLQIKLTEDDTNEAIERITASLPNIIISVTDIVAERLLEAWKADAGRIIGEEKENISQFTSEILEFWGEAIRLLEILRSVRSVLKLFCY